VLHKGAATNEVAMIGHLLRTSFLAFVCATAAMSTATARSGGSGGFDGEWSVTIVTQRGTCDRAYRYGITIRGGHVSYDGGMVRMSGNVNPSGGVQVRVSSEGAFASGTGRLSGSSGRGSWSGRSGGNACSGYWTATRGG
jgi:hypothetical protein